MALASVVAFLPDTKGAPAKPKKKPGLDPKDTMSDFKERRITGLEEEARAARAESEKVQSEYAGEKAKFKEAIDKHEQMEQELNEHKNRPFPEEEARGMVQ